MFDPGTDPTGCADARGPGNLPGLDAAKMDLLAARNAALNDVLAAGAAKYGFAVARPELRPLCPVGDGARDGLGPDLQGLAGPHPFHPTGVESLRMAAAVAQLLEPDRAP